jgi:CrcB protein
MAQQFEEINIMGWVPVAIGFGSVVGALGRYYLTLFWTRKLGSLFPFGTLFVNLTGALVIGLVAILAPAYGVPEILQKLILVGFLGAYTTFSSYILDSANLFRSSRFIVALFYWIGSPVLGFLCVELGAQLGRGLS